MLVVVSDLHFLDKPEPLNRMPGRIGERIEQIVDSHRAVTSEVVIILLGDIFDFLHSSKWIKRGARPWETDQDELQAYVMLAIAKDIVKANQDFFAAIGRLSCKHKAKIEYIIGNHDALLNQEMGRASRAIIRTALGLGASDAEFPSIYHRREYRAILEHGHDFDAYNASTKGRRPVGDVIVVEILEGLQFRLCERLGIDAESRDAAFLAELKAINPLQVRSLIRWIELGILEMKRKGVRVQPSVGEAAEDVRRALKAIRRHQITKHWYIKLWRLGLQLLKLVGRDSLVAAFAYAAPKFISLPLGQSIRTTHIRARDEFEARVYEDWADYMVMGHTHFAEIVPYETPTRDVTRPKYYLNTGTWGQVYEFTPFPSGKLTGSAFSLLHEESVLLIFSKSEATAVGRDFELHTVRGEVSAV